MSRLGRGFPINRFVSDPPPAATPAAGSYNELFGLGAHSEDHALELAAHCQDDAASTTIVDSSSNGRDGTLAGGDNTSDKATTGPNSWLTSALALNGTDDRLDFPTSIAVTGAGVRTILARVSLGGFDATFGEPILGFNGDGGDGERFGCWAEDNAVSVGFSGHRVITPDPLSTGVFYLVALRVPEAAQTTDDVDILIDAVNQSLSTESGGDAEILNTSAPDSPLPSFGYETGQGDYGQHTFADISVFSRALSDAEVDEILDGPEPVNSVAPVVSGTEETGETLTATTGTWGLDSPFAAGSNGTISYGYQWTRSDDGSGTNEADIGGATSSSYVLQAADFNKFIRCRVRATNDGGYDADADTNSLFTGAITGNPIDLTAGVQDAEAQQLTPTYAIGTQFSAGIQDADAELLAASLAAGFSGTALISADAIGEQLAAAIAALGHRFTASYHNAYGNALPTFETIGPIVINPHRLNYGGTLFIDRPFNGEGVNLYAAGEESLIYRRLRILGTRGIIKGSAGVHDLAASSVLKTARVGSAADPTDSIVYSLPADLAGVALNGVSTGIAGAASFQVAGDVTAWLTVGELILIAGSTANDGFYTVRATPSYAGGNTTIPVDEAISDGTVDGDLAREVVFDVRKYLDDWENASDRYRMRTVFLDSSRAEVSVILGRASLLDVEVRAGGICRIRFVYIPDTRAGVQANTFRAVATSGPTSPDDATITQTPTGRTILEIDTPALQDAGAYVYTIQAENGATVKELLSGIALTADADGPSAPTSAASSPW